MPGGNVLTFYVGKQQRWVNTKSAGFFVSLKSQVEKVISQDIQAMITLDVWTVYIWSWE